MNESEAIIPDEIILPGCRIDKANKNIKIETLIEYVNRGLTYSEIAKLTGCSRQNVQQRLENAEFSREDLENFKKNRSAVFQFLQSKLLNSIDMDEIKELSPLQRIVGAGILFDKEDKLSKPDEKIDTFAVRASLEEIEKRKKELLDKVRRSRQMQDATRIGENKTNENK